MACETLRERLQPVAAKLLDVPANTELSFAAGWVRVKAQPERSVAFHEVTGAAYLGIFMVFS